MREFRSLVRALSVAPERAPLREHHARATWVAPRIPASGDRAAPLEHLAAPPSSATSACWVVCAIARPTVQALFSPRALRGSASAGPMRATSSAFLAHECLGHSRPAGDHGRHLQLRAARHQRIYSNARGSARSADRSHPSRTLHLYVALDARHNSSHGLPLRRVQNRDGLWAMHRRVLAPEEVSVGYGVRGRYLLAHPALHRPADECGRRRMRPVGSLLHCRRGDWGLFGNPAENRSGT